MKLASFRPLLVEDPAVYEVDGDRLRSTEMEVEGPGKTLEKTSYRVLRDRFIGEGVVECRWKFGDTSVRTLKGEWRRPGMANTAENAWRFLVLD